MANNEEFFCEHCGCETLFILREDGWHCDECDNLLGSQPFDEEEFWEFEDEHGAAIHCDYCGNFITVRQIVRNQLAMCPYCGDEINETKMQSKGYELDENSEWVSVEE